MTTLRQWAENYLKKDLDFQSFTKMTVRQAVEAYIVNVQNAMFPIPPSVSVSYEEVIVVYKRTSSAHVHLLDLDDVRTVDSESFCQLFAGVERITTFMLAAAYLRETGNIHPMLARRFR